MAHLVLAQGRQHHVSNIRPRSAPKVALYARVSTVDRSQEPETQLMPLRDFCQGQGWEIYQEYVDHASALDVARRTAWRALMDDAARRKFNLVLVFKLDRAFRSVKHLHDTLTAWEVLGVGFQSVRERFETSTALGRLLLNLLACLAEFELELIGERVRAGMERARRQGKRIGRPKVSDNPRFAVPYKKVCDRLRTGELSRRQAAQQLGIGYATLKRLLDDHDRAAVGPFDESGRS